MNNNETTAVRALRQCAWEALLAIKGGSPSDAKVLLLEGLLTFEINGPEELRAGSKPEPRRPW